MPLGTLSIARINLVTGFAIVAVVSGCASVHPSRPVPLGSTLSPAELTTMLPSKDIDGNPLPIGKVATIYYFTGPECPISRAYSPDVARSVERDAARGVAWVMAFPEQGITVDNIRKFRQDYSLTLPAFRDPDNALCCELGVTVIPSVAVISASGELIYRGRIDNRFQSIGVSRGPPTIRDVDDLVNSLVSGTPCTPTQTPAVGCVLAPCSNAGY